MKRQSAGKGLFAALAISFLCLIGMSAFAQESSVKTVSMTSDPKAQVVLTEAEVRALITNKSVTWEADQWGLCRNDFKADGTFTFECNGSNNKYYDTGKWYFKDHESEPRRMLCREYDKQQKKGCMSMARSEGGEINYFFGLSKKKQDKVTRITELVNVPM